MRVRQFESLCNIGLFALTFDMYMYKRSACHVTRIHFYLTPIH
jgi:hypothetical protein